MKSMPLFIVLLISGALAACGGSTSSSGPGSLAVSPVTASVTAGGTQLFTVSGGSGGTTTWQVNGTTGGNASTGIITTGGLYTAPAVPPVNQPITITATQGSLSGTASVTATYSIQSLNGQYIFSFQELQVSSMKSNNAVGVITADGNGNLSGTEDVNGPSGVFKSQPVTGTYTLSANGQGTLTIGGGSAGTLNLTVTLVVGAAEGLLMDVTSGNVGAGNLFPMTSTVNSASDLSGNYTIDLGAAVASNNNSVGLLALSASNITGSYMDTNNAGAVTSSGPGTVSGTYSVGSSNNRGTLSLRVGANANNYAFYAVSPNQLELICTDTGCTNTGALNTQTSQTVTSGNYVYSFIGSGSGQTPDALLITGSMTSTTGTGGTANLTFYENYNGSFVGPTTGSTTYTVPSYGRGSMALPTPFGNSRNFVFYVQSPSQLYTLETSPGYNTSGFGTGAQDNAAAVTGQYLLFTLGQEPYSQSYSTTQAILQVANNGQVTGQEIVNVNGMMSSEPVSVSGTITATSTSGTYTMTLGLGNGQFASYVLAASSSGILTVIGTDNDEVSAGGMLIQYTTQ